MTEKEIKNGILKGYSEGKGMKILAREFGWNYSKVRNFIHNSGIRVRKNNEITDHLRMVRSKNQKERIKRHGVHISTSSRLGVNGFFWNESRKKWVFLRSSYEYIYAKWLDKQNKDWDVEVYQLKINNVWYRPDFFLYENGSLASIVEVKSKYIESIQKERSKSVCEFDGVPVERIYSVEPFLPKNSSYTKELKRWKKIANSNKLLREKDLDEQNRAKEKEKEEEKKKKREWRNCVVCGNRFFVLKSLYQTTCGLDECKRKSRGIRTTMEANERLPIQKEKIIQLYLKNKPLLIGKNGKRSLKPLYSTLKKNNLPVHINTLRKIFEVNSLLDIIKILEEND